MGAVDLQDVLLPDQQTQLKPCKDTRVHFIDWMRCVLVFCVVLAHSSVIGMKGGVVTAHTIGKQPPHVVVDDRTWTTEDPSPLAVRWISLLRPSTLPMLFWISGAAFGLSFRGQVWRRLRRSLLWIVLYTVAGLACNSIVVFLGPLEDDTCSPADHDRATCKGLLWNFRVWPWQGMSAVTVQFWYTAFLVVFLLLNWPLLWVILTKKLSRSCIGVVLVVQWLLTVGVYAFLLLLTGSLCTEPKKAFVSLTLYELAFVIFSALAVTEIREMLFPPTLIRNISARMVHYILATVLWLQFSTTPFAEKIDYFSWPSFFYVFVGFNKYFVLGFIMLREDARPIVSKVWPLMVVFIIVSAQSSNFDQAGYLTFPFYPRVSDRMLLIAHGLLVTFCIDRVGRLAGDQCIPIPEVINHAGLLLFLCHELFLAVLIYNGLDHAMHAWLASGLMSIVIAAVLTYVPRAICRTRY